MNEEISILDKSSSNNNRDQSTVTNPLVNSSFEIRSPKTENLKTIESFNTNSNMLTCYDFELENEDYFRKTLCTRFNQIIFIIMAFFLIILIILLFFI